MTRDWVRFIQQMKHLLRCCGEATRTVGGRIGFRSGRKNMCSVDLNVAGGQWSFDQAAYEEADACLVVAPGFLSKLVSDPAACTQGVRDLRVFALKDRQRITLLGQLFAQQHNTNQYSVGG